MDNSTIFALSFLAYIVITTILSILYFLKRTKLNASLLQLKKLSKIEEQHENLSVKFNAETVKSKKLEERFSPVIAVEEQVETARAKAIEQLQSMIKEKNLANAKLLEVEQELKYKKQYLADIKLDISKLSDAHELNLDGYNQPVFELDDHPAYVVAIKILKEKQKSLIRKQEAVICPIDWTVGDSRREGKKAVGRLIRLTLRAFNNECDLMIKNLTWKNAERTKEKIFRLVEILNGLNESMQLTITRQYLDLKIEEVDLSNAEKLKKEEEKERLRSQREAEREEAKAQREYISEIKRQEKLERDKQTALQAARERLSIASDEHREAIESEILLIEKELSETMLQKGRLLSMAEQTRIGHVYIISNHGSFGEQVVKIGMTRRLEPMDRVKELGDASVPFPFDVHAIIFSEDAPKLERELHEKFANRRVNKVNTRKEFFNIDIRELETELHQILPNVPFESKAPSIEYTQSASSILPN